MFLASFDFVRMGVLLYFLEIVVEWHLVIFKMNGRAKVSIWQSNMYKNGVKKSLSSSK